MTTQRHLKHVWPHLWMWGALALSLLLLLLSCPAQGATPAQPGAPPLPANGTFQVAVMRKGAWVPAGETAHGEVPMGATLLLKGLATGEPIHVRITTRAAGAAQLDAVLLNGRGPLAARNAVVHKLAAPDHDVTNATGRTIELTFTPIGETSATLTVIGRIAGKAPPTTPYQFPLRNQGQAASDAWASYAYRLGDRPGLLTVNGELDEEHLGVPLFAERVTPGPGHPEGFAYGWVRNDSRFLYVAIDFTADNTYDADQDQARTFVRVNNVWREFKVDVSDRAWGRSGYTYTDRAPYEHKVYEFAIPLTELSLAGAPKGTPVHLAFSLTGAGMPGTR